jgi:hypothetical protein
MGSRDSVVGTATGYGLDDWGVRVRVPVRSRIFSSRCPDRLWGSSNLLSDGFPETPSPGIKRPGREAPTSAEVRKIWIYTSTAPYAFMAILAPVPVVRRSCSRDFSTPQIETLERLDWYTFGLVCDSTVKWKCDNSCSFHLLQAHPFLLTLNVGLLTWWVFTYLDLSSIFWYITKVTDVSEEYMISFLGKWRRRVPWKCQLTSNGHSS